MSGDAARRLQPDPEAVRADLYERLDAIMREWAAFELGGDPPHILLLATWGKRTIRRDYPLDADDPPVHPDGPDEANQLFWWRGNSVSLRPLEMALVAHIWRVGSCSLAECCQAVWGTPAKKRATFNDLQYDLNRMLAAIKCGRQICVTRGGIVHFG